MQTKPVTLTIAGSDSCSGAGIQADLKTFHDHQVHGLTALTSIVAETPLEVSSILPLPLPTVQEQIELLLQSYPISAIKTGLIPTPAISVAVHELLAESDIPLIVDPVMVASSGASLSDTSTLDILRERILPITTLVTPNISEASAILDRDISTPDQLLQAAKDISQTYHTSCLIKGGHLPGEGNRVDILWHLNEAHTYTHPKIDLPPSGVHGTGCTLSAAITAEIAHKKNLPSAVDNAISYVQSLLKQSYSWPHSNPYTLPPQTTQTIHCLGW